MCYKLIFFVFLGARLDLEQKSPLVTEGIVIYDKSSANGDKTKKWRRPEAFTPDFLLNMKAEAL